MTTYEMLYSMLRPTLPVLHQLVFRELNQLCRRSRDARKPRLLDVGGRKSPYSIGLPAVVTILDLPRESQTQELLNLGLTSELEAQLRRRRSNIQSVLYDDMTEPKAPLDEAFDGVIAVEVLEHVARDQQFLANIVQALRPGGWFFMTTPNGDYIRNEGPHRNPDHIRHYTRSELEALLNHYFSSCRVTHAVRTGPNRVRGLRSFALRKPVRTIATMLANVTNRLESRHMPPNGQRAAHLIAVATKSPA